jgi:hypothetical protein
VPVEFDARSEASAHRTEVLLPLRNVFLGASVALFGFGAASLAYEFYRFSGSSLPLSNQVLSAAPLLGGAVALIAAGVYLLLQCPVLYRKLPTTYLLDSEGFTAKWANGDTIRESWDDPSLRLYLRDMRDLLDVKGSPTLISYAGSFAPFAVPSEFYDRVLSEAKKRSLVAKASFYRGRGGLKIHTATVRGRNTG